MLSLQRLALNPTLRLAMEQNYSVLSSVTEHRIMPRVFAAADYYCRPDQHRYLSLTRTNLKQDPSRASLICSYMCGWYLIHWPCVALR